MIKLSAGRPVAAAMVYFALAFLGVRAWLNVPNELVPNAQLPRLTVTGTWPSASPETVEAFLTSPLEAEIQLVEGVEKVTSRSREGTANIEIEFNRDTDMDFARLDLSERLNNLEETVLPHGVQGVSVSQYEPEEIARARYRSLLSYTFTGPRTLAALREHLDEVVVPELSQVRGVGVVYAMGGRQRILKVELDKEVMAALGVTTGDVGGKLSSLDLVREAGAVREGEKEWTVTIRNRPASAQDVSEAIVKSDGDRIIRISDIAVVRHTYEDPRSFYRIDARPAVQVTIQKEIGSNSVRVADRVKERMKQIELRNPPNTRFILDRDESEEIRREWDHMILCAIVSAIVVFVVLFLFLSLRAALVVFATVLFSVLIAINVVYFAGYSMNRFTFMGLVAGLGLYVDNSIVVLENIYRRWEAGHSRREAIVEGARHMVLPIMAATMTTLIVYAPFLYFSGEQRIYYLPMAIMIALSVIGSVLVAFSFIPALVGKLLPRRDPDAPAGGLGGEAFYQRFYRNLLNRTLNWPWVTVVVPVLLLAGSYYVFDREVARGRIWGFGGSGESTYIDIYISLPRGSDIDRTDVLTQFFEERLQQMPEVKSFNTRVNPTSSQTRVTFPRELTHTDVPVRIKEQLFAYSLGFARAEVRVYGYGPSFYGGGGGGGGNYHIDILGYNYEKVREIAEVLGARLRRQARIRDVNTNADFRYGSDRATEFAVIINRDVAAQHGIPVNHLVGQINAAVQGQVSGSTIKMGGDEIRYDVKLEGYREVDLHELRKTLVLTPTGVPIRLGELISIEERNLLSTILREDQQYRRRVSYEFRGPYKLGNLVHESVIDATEVPPGYTVKKSEGYSWRTDDQREVWLVLGVALFLVFMVTSALFESLRQPLCVLLSVPMALIGVFLIFFYTGATFTREAYIGIIMMGGIVVNNAILLVDHINRVRRETALTLKQAILKGTMERVRPILMTTTTTIGALLPLVLLAPSVNANIWNALAYTLIGGLTASTFLVLTVTPALYLLFERHGGLIAAIILLLVVTPALYLVFTRVFEWSWPFASMSLLLIMVLSHALYVAFTRGRARGGGGEPAGGSEGSGGTAPA
jgi:HAE1 family hydrophobic/amphiphilic exporter-1